MNRRLFRALVLLLALCAAGAAYGQPLVGCDHKPIKDPAYYADRRHGAGLALRQFVEEASIHKAAGDEVSVSPAAPVLKGRQLTARPYWTGHGASAPSWRAAWSGQ
jgi:hypothetical protein